MNNTASVVQLCNKDVSHGDKVATSHVSKGKRSERDKCSCIYDYFFGEEVTTETGQLAASTSTTTTIRKLVQARP